MRTANRTPEGQLLVAGELLSDEALVYQCRKHRGYVRWLVGGGVASSRHIAEACYEAQYYRDHLHLRRSIRRMARDVWEAPGCSGCGSPLLELATPDGFCSPGCRYETLEVNR